MTRISSKKKDNKKTIHLFIYVVLLNAMQSLNIIITHIINSYQQHIEMLFFFNVIESHYLMIVSPTTPAKVSFDIAQHTFDYRFLILNTATWQKPQKILSYIFLNEMFAINTNTYYEEKKASLLRKPKKKKKICLALDLRKQQVYFNPLIPT